MNVHLSKSSLAKLGTVKPELITLVNKALQNMPFDVTILEGIRTIDRQKELVAQGKSQTLRSKHLTGDAIDIAPYPIDWNDWKRFEQMANVLLEAGDGKIEWGGNWKSFRDGPHFQLK